MTISITFYTEKMKGEVVNLICNQYGYEKVKYITFFDLFYSNSFQKKAIMIVALDGNKVVGFQSFFYWPYSKNGKTYNSYQSGNSIVDSSYRGKGIFKKLLHFIDDKNLSIDFMVGFPVEDSYKSFIKSNWKNPFNLQWYLKTNCLLSVFFKPNHKILEQKFETIQKANINGNSDLIMISDENDFVSWRKGFYKNQHYYFNYSNDTNTCQIGFKLNIRKKYLKELIIGQLNGDIDNLPFLEEALLAFLKQIRKIKFITFVSIAINTTNTKMLSTLEKLKFKKTDKKIYFILKEMNKKISEADFPNWVLLRGDIDTW
ncbi:MAG TPA: hypothetical protein VIN73_08725 [Vicingaceae bacterium]